MTTRPNCRPTNRLPLHSEVPNWTLYTTKHGLSPPPDSSRLQHSGQVQRLESCARSPGLRQHRHSALSFLASMESRMRRSLRSMRGPVRFQRGRSFTSNRIFIRIVRQTADLKLRVYHRFRSIATIRGLSKRVQPRWDQQQKNSAHTVWRSLLARSLSSRARRKSILTKSALRMQAFTILKPG
jgi:hypothetical protein